MEVDRKSANSAGPGHIRFELGQFGNFLCNLQLRPQIFLQPLDLKECTVPHLKDLIHICLEPEVQGCDMTFNRFFVGSIYPYFISYRGKWVNLFCRSFTPLVAPSNLQEVKCKSTHKFSYFPPALWWKIFRQFLQGVAKMVK